METLTDDLELWESCLREIYDSPASVTAVTGEWKTGKTNLALYLAYDDLQNIMGLVKKIGTNIKVYKDRRFEELNPEIVYVDNFTDLEIFLFSDRKPKCFIYDEAIKSTPSRKAMSQLNTKWMEYVPELSKARCHLIVVTQAKDYTESIFLNPIFNRAEWHKRDITTVELYLPRRYENYTFYDVPPTSLTYDPYSQAIWKLQSPLKFSKLPLEVQILFRYGSGFSMDDIKQEYNLPDRKEVKRKMIQGIKFLENFVAKWQQSEVGDKEKSFLPQSI